MIDKLKQLNWFKAMSFLRNAVTGGTIMLFLTFGHKDEPPAMSAESVDKLCLYIGYGVGLIVLFGFITELLRPKK